MSKCKDECADHVQKLLKQIEQLKDQLAMADKHIGWLKGAKVKLNRSIKLRDNAFDALITVTDKEKKRLRDALQALYDEQNGPPLIRYEKQWQAAMDDAEALLGDN